MIDETLLILKNTPNLRAKLEKLGYQPYKLRSEDSYEKAASYWVEECYDNLIIETKDKVYYGLGTDEINIKPEIVNNTLNCGTDEVLLFSKLNP